MQIDPFSSIDELAGSIAAGEILPADLLTMYLERIRRHDPCLHAFTTVAEAGARLQVAESDRPSGKGSCGRALFGIPIPIKDCYHVGGMRTTFNSPMFRDWVPAEDDIFVAKLRGAGAILLGKLNLNQFFSIPSSGDLFPPPRNPWNTDCVTIGTSSGAGTAVAAGLCAAALGGDGGGSVRLPAGQCNLVGLKPTHNLIPYKNPRRITDIGILARTVMDCAHVLGAVASYASPDERFPDAEVPHYARLAAGESDLSQFKVAVPWEYIRSIPLEPEVEESFRQALEVLAKLGLHVYTVDFPELEAYRAATFIILAANGFTQHDQNLHSHWEEYSENSRLNATRGAFVSAADYIRALHVGDAGRARIDGVLERFNLIALPTSPVVTSEAARQNPKLHSVGGNAAYTAPFNVTGHPVVSLPCGMSSVGLPMGFQLVARHYEEGFLLNVSQAYEQATPWHTQRPKDFA
ncbi:MAG: amidase [Spirochaetales bacterium]|nr:amidase [Spirochaetales bacterium]